MSDEQKQRNEKGKFVAGNKAAKGNPVNRRVQMLRIAAIRSADSAAVFDMLDMLKTKALKDRDVAAAKEWFDRTLGKAKQITELSGVDGQPIQLQRQVNLKNLSDEELITLEKLYEKADHVATQAGDQS